MSSSHIPVASGGLSTCKLLAASVLSLHNSLCTSIASSHMLETLGVLSLRKPRATSPSSPSKPVAAGVLSACKSGVEGILRPAKGR